MISSSLLKFRRFDAPRRRKHLRRDARHELALELSASGARRTFAGQRRLDRRQVRQVADYMNANLQNDIAPMTANVALSRFHFVRRSSRLACRRTSISWRAE
jgi:hypothetical protein